MGVRDLIALLKRTCPHVIRPLPNRLQDLQGKTVAIDGTLVTQRLHFARIPYDKRHVLGWHRLIMDMKAAGVNAICVFDSPGRASAKEQELHRRRAQRKLDETRASIERKRQARLNDLLQVFEKVQSLAIDAQLELAQRVRAAHSGREGGLPANQKKKKKSRVQPQQDRSGSSPDMIPHPSIFEALEEEVQKGYQAYLAAGAPSQTHPADERDADIERHDGEDQSVIGDDLFYPESKAQRALTEEEGEVWEEILAGREDNHDAFNGRSKLEILTKRNDTLLDTLNRRKPPQKAVFQESKAILRAMGVAVLQSPALVEGEAFAAALVHHGLADYVASDDTDVIIYEAPLIRNFVSRKMPLTVVNGTEVREALKLDRGSFVDLALLCGTDFTKRMPNIGPHTALKLIRKHAKIENLLQDPIFLAKPPKNSYIQEIVLGRAIFEGLPAIDKSFNIEQRDIDHVKVQAMLEEFGLARATALPFDYAGLLDGNFSTVAPAAFTSHADFDKTENDFGDYVFTKTASSLTPGNDQLPPT